MKILCFAGYYKPAFKAGGPVKTILNMVEQLPDISFDIVTRDRDLGDNDSFPGIVSGRWVSIGNANVIYLSKSSQSFLDMIRIVNSVEFDVLYLNSYFDYSFSIKVIFALKLGLLPASAVVLAPRGEFSKGALAIKPLKKYLFMKLSSLFGCYRDVVWQASTEFEKQDIIDALAVPHDSIFVAKDLPEKYTDPINPDSFVSGSILRVVFLSRISPKKNLDFALKVLSSVKSEIVFDIYGPLEDESYWLECNRLISDLPSNIRVSYRGVVNPTDVKQVFAAYDLFFFPTRGENYGHVIAEALSVGTAVLISDQTPWLNLSHDLVGWDLPLSHPESFAEKIDLLATYSPEYRTNLRKCIVNSAFARINSEADITNNRNLFLFAVNKLNSYKA